MAGVITRDELKHLSDRIYDLDKNTTFPDIQYRLMLVANDLQGIVYHLTKTDRPVLEWHDKNPTEEGAD